MESLARVIGSASHDTHEATAYRNDFLPTAQPFDLIFADPPYEAGSGTAVADAVAKAGWLAPGGWMAVETHRGDTVRAPEDWTIEAERDVGRARLPLLRA